MSALPLESQPRRLGEILIGWGWLPMAARPVFYWGPTLVLGGLSVFAWLSAFLGADPPALVARLLGAAS